MKAREDSTVSGLISGLQLCKTRRSLDKLCVTTFALGWLAAR